MNKMISSEELLFGLKVPSPKHKKREKELKKQKEQLHSQAGFTLASMRSISSLAVALNNHSFSDSKQTDPAVEVQRLAFKSARKTEELAIIDFDFLESL